MRSFLTTAARVVLLLTAGVALGWAGWDLMGRGPTLGVVLALVLPTVLLLGLAALVMAADQERDDL